MNGNEKRYQARIAKLRPLMEAAGCEAVIVASAANLFYFTGLWIDAHERLLALVVKRNGEALLVAPDLHRGELAHQQMSAVFWRDGEDAAALLANALPTSGAVGVDEAWASGHLIALMRHRPHIVWTGSAGLLGAIRRVKDAFELDRIRESAAVLNRVMAAFMPHLRAGRTEEQLLGQLLELWKQEGVRELSFDPTVAAGANGANPHHTPGQAVVQGGDLVIVDTGGKLNRYCSDMTRTFSIGNPSAEQREVYELVREAQAAGARAVRPGITLSEVDRIVRNVIEQGGYGPYFVHRTGHGIGIDIHEEPSVQGGNELVIEPGMVFSVEPGIYVPGKFGVRIEDIVIVTADGCESVNEPVSKQLTILG
ncbi:MAG: peptidase [Paenibacillus sp.]|nr:peptidase [Paenibacillus sp.]